MKTSSPKEKSNKSLSEANKLYQRKDKVTTNMQFVDNRPGTVAQLKRQAIANSSSKVAQLKQLQQMANHSATHSDATPIQLKGKNKRSSWNAKQIAQNERLFARREQRQARYAAARARPVIPARPAVMGGAGDGYRQTWIVNGIHCIFSSGHGYRPNHHRPHQPPGPNIQLLGTMDQIERSILHDLFIRTGLPGIGVQGTRGITIRGQHVEYRFRHIDATHIGIGTYYQVG